MLQLQQLRLRQYALFQEQDFTFEAGLTVIGGNNRVGKTLLLSPLRPLFFGLPSGEHLPRGSDVQLDVRRVVPDGRNYSMTIGAATTKTRPDWSLFVNKQDMATHRKRDVRQLIDRRIGLTEDLFDATCHIAAGGRNLPLYAGTPAAKMDWLSSVFNLAATYNEWQADVAAKLDELHRDEVKLQVLEQSLIEVPSKPDEDKLERRQQTHLKIKQRIAQWTGLRTKAEELKSLRKLLQAVKQQQTPFSKGELQNLIARLEDQLLELRKYRDQASDYKAELRLWQQAKAKRAELFKQLPRKYRPTSSKHTRNIIKRLQHLQAHWSKQIAEAEDTNADYDAAMSAKKHLKSMTKPALSQAKAIRALARAKSDGGFALRMSDQLSTTEAGKPCPECGTELTSKHIHRVRDKYAIKLKQAKKAIEIAEQAIVYWDMVEIAEQDVVYTDILRLQAKVDQVDKYVAILEKIVQTTEAVEPQRPKQVSNISGEVVQSKLDKCKADLALHVAHGREQFPSLQKLRQRIEELETSLGKFDADELAELSDRAIELGEINRAAEMRLREHARATKHNAAIEVEIAELQRRVRRVRPLKVLKEAFSRSGILLNAMNDVIQHLLQELNSLVPLLINEKFRVDIVTGPRKLNVIVERNGSSESIRSLSTSEQRCWALLFATAMLRILPNSMLTDTIILDELEANMDINSRRRYAKEFLPYLQTIVPKVIVVTPLISGELILQPDRAYRVVKNNNVSSLREL